MWRAWEKSPLPEIRRIGKIGEIMDNSRRGNLTRLALNPETKLPDLKVEIRGKRLSGLGRRENKADIYTAAYTLPETLENPDAVFEGLRFDDDEPRSCNSPGWLCYAKHPARRYKNDGSAFETPKNQIFLVFVTVDKMVYNWAWDDADENALVHGEYMPDDYENRFAQQVFPVTQTFQGERHDRYDR